MCYKLLFIQLVTAAKYTEAAATYIYSVIQKDGLNFVRLYFLNCTCYVNDLHNI